MQQTEKEKISEEIKQIEKEMAEADFWSDKNRAQNAIKRMQDLKEKLSGVGKYDKGDAILTIYAGAGGDDAEDWAKMLLNMYLRFVQKKGWGTQILFQNQNSLGGFRTITIEITGKNVYGTLKHEAGVHRLVRQSPFNSKGLRHTSFAMAEVIPKLEKIDDFVVPESELKIEFTKSSGPGGQNVNKRETAVRIIHEPTKISVTVETERSQHQNREKAMEIIYGKLYNLMQDEEMKKEAGMQISKTVDAEWGSQIRSYVLHPYKMVKDHRTNVETSDTDGILAGDLEVFIEAFKNN